jgi:predicted GNAT family acetyltransferase
MTDWDFAKVEVMTATSVRDNKARSRFELDVEGGVAFANYRLASSTVIITHTETPRALRGRGIASELVQGALQLIRADGLIKGRRWLRFCGGLPAKASGICGSGGVTSTSSPTNSGSSPRKRRESGDDGK